MKQKLFLLLAVVVVIVLLVWLFSSGPSPSSTSPAPRARNLSANDAKRIADLEQIKSALDQYVAKVGALPAPDQYGESAGLPGFWENYWDLSAEDKNGDGLPFLDFLVEAGIVKSVPTDPVNRAEAQNDPRGGSQYVYFLVPPGYVYEGGTCDDKPDRWHYMIAVTKLDDKTTAPMEGAGCSCLWKNRPGYFQGVFDYLLCGEFDATPETVQRAAVTLEERTAAFRQARDAAKLGKLYGAEDQRRVEDIARIQEGLKTYLAKIGPLPAPRDYGESDDFPLGFWQGYWDLSSEDADKDGKPFLDFLAESGVMPSVPVDPENQGASDGDPRAGRQYVYFVAAPHDPFGGGPCSKAKEEWVYLLGITDLRSEVSRPPVKIKGSGCECLWNEQPNMFQTQFDYVVCGTFPRPPGSTGDGGNR